MIKKILVLICLFWGFTLPIQLANAQSIQQQQMAKLRYMVGDWVGISSTYKDGKIDKQIPAYEKIQYKLDSSIITIDLASESLQLHTVIYYSEEDETYYYNSYYKTGAGRYKAEFSDNKLTVWASKKKRFIFQATPEGKFQEYGEQLEDGKWIKYFEDNFKRMP